jgi:Icc-related predicted phosphoesterase
MQKEVLRIAAVGDIHVKKGSQGQLHPIFEQLSERADVLLLCGDLTDYGLPEEAKILARELTSSIQIPTIAVMGNHDFESDQQDDVTKILIDAGVVVLDGSSHEIHGVGFAGVKGFGGGFGRRSLGAWGEKIIKQFVHETIEEALKLESALARLRTPTKIAVLHYSPIQETVFGEPLEIVAFLGSTRLEEPLDRYRVNAVFHGHAHHGVPEGKTKTGIPVYNVAMPLLRRTLSDTLPVRIVEVATSEVPASEVQRAPAT